MTARILVVEDDPVSRDLIASLLQARGYDVETANDSFGALRLIQDKCYDLVFIDYHLPEMDGYALARMMRTLGEKSGTNLNMVALTADKFGLAARRGADAVFDRILAKPIEPEALFAFTDGFLNPDGHAAHPVQTKPVTDSIVAKSDPSDGVSAAKILWGLRGLPDRPTAAAFPVPSPSERTALERCFRLVDAETAECWILLKPAGMVEIEARRETAASYLKPVFCLNESGMASADGWFNVGDSGSWTLIAETLAAFARRAADLPSKPHGIDDFDRRFLAYLRVSARALVVRRGADGRLSFEGTGGFRTAAIIPALKRLGMIGLVSATPRPSNPSELIVTATDVAAVSADATNAAEACR